MLCCSEDRKTPFCPECGKMLRPPNPLEEILIHGKATLRGMEKRRERRLKYDSESKLNIKCIEKWQRWIDALKKAIGK